MGPSRKWTEDTAVTVQSVSIKFPIKENLFICFKCDKSQVSMVGGEGKFCWCGRNSALDVTVQNIGTKPMKLSQDLTRSAQE